MKFCVSCPGLFALCLRRSSGVMPAFRSACRCSACFPLVVHDALPRLGPAQPFRSVMVAIIGPSIHCCSAPINAEAQALVSSPALQVSPLLVCRHWTC